MWTILAEELKDPKRTAMIAAVSAQMGQSGDLKKVPDQIKLASGTIGIRAKRQEMPFRYFPDFHVYLFIQRKKKKSGQMFKRVCLVHWPGFAASMASIPLNSSSAQMLRLFRVKMLLGVNKKQTKNPPIT